MKQFIYKMIILIIAVIIIYEFTIGKQISQFKAQTDILISKEGRKESINKLRDELKKAIKKERYLSKEDALLINEFINKIKNEVESIEIDKIAKKYNTNNYIVAIMEIEKDKLKIFLKMNLNKNEVSRNFSFENIDLSKNEKIDFLTQNLKTNILDLWKELNIVNYDFPLSINILFNSKSFQSLLDLEKIMDKMQIINNYSIKKMNINEIMFDIEYLGSPRKLSEEFLEFDYALKYLKGTWNLRKNE